MATLDSNPQNNTNKMDVDNSEESKTNDAPVATQEKIYELDESWTQDIEDEYNPESFIKEYPKLKKLLQTYHLDPMQHTIDITKMVHSPSPTIYLLDSSLLHHKTVK